MEFLLHITRDSDNSYPTAHLAIDETYDSHVAISISDSVRKVLVKRGDLIRVLRALEAPRER